MASDLTIGKLAKAVGVNVQTVRYHERRKLLPPTSRMPSGYRQYGDEALRRLRFIKNAQALGFTLRRSLSWSSIKSLNESPVSFPSIALDSLVPRPCRSCNTPALNT